MSPIEPWSVCSDVDERDESEAREGGNHVIDTTPRLCRIITAKAGDMLTRSFQRKSVGAAHVEGKGGANNGGVRLSGWVDLSPSQVEHERPNWVPQEAQDM